MPHRAAVEWDRHWRLFQIGDNDWIWIMCVCVRACTCVNAFANVFIYSRVLKDSCVYVFMGLWTQTHFCTDAVRMCVLWISIYAHAFRAQTSSWFVATIIVVLFLMLPPQTMSAFSFQAQSFAVFYIIVPSLSDYNPDQSPLVFSADNNFNPMLLFT